MCICELATCWRPNACRARLSDGVAGRLSARGLLHYEGSLGHQSGGTADIRKRFCETSLSAITADTDRWPDCVLSAILCPLDFDQLMTVYEVVEISAGHTTSEWDCAHCWCGPRMSIVVVCCLCFSCTLLMWLLLITACQNNHLYCHLPGRSLVWKFYKSLEWHQKVSADVQKVWGHLWNVGGLLVLGKVVHFEISNSKTASHQKCGRVFQCWKRCLSADLGAGILAATWHEKIFFSSRWL